MKVLLVCQGNITSYQQVTSKYCSQRLRPALLCAFVCLRQSSQCPAQLSLLCTLLLTAVCIATTIVQDTRSRETNKKGHRERGAYPWISTTSFACKCLQWTESIPVQPLLLSHASVWQP